MLSSLFGRDQHASESETLILTEFQLLKVEGNASIKRQTKQNLRKIILGAAEAAEWSPLYPGIEHFSWSRH